MESILELKIQRLRFLRVCVQPRQTVLTAAGSIGQASGDLLRQIGESETDERFQVMLNVFVFIDCYFSS